jgi:glycosyl hydrolase family 62
MLPKHISYAMFFLAIVALAHAVEPALRSGNFHWRATAPVLQPEDRDGDHYYSVKDPSVVRYRGRWHLFSTIRGRNRSHQIEYISFKDWPEAAQARRTTLRLTSGFFAAPDVFYFAPHKKWYLIYQFVDQSRKPALQPAYSTTTNIDDPASWTAPQMLYTESPQSVKNWLDFWIICDARQAHLFFTTDHGQMLRADAPLAEFPHGWDEPRVVLDEDIYEASHTYRVKGPERYLTIIEARAPAGRRYYKAYLADRLTGEWQPLAATFEKPFAALSNVSFQGEGWTQSISHGELLRDGYDQTLTIDPAHLTLLYQGVSDRDQKDKVYGQIPYRLGLLYATP